MKNKLKYITEFLEKFLCSTIVVTLALIFCLYIIFLQNLKPVTPVPIVDIEGSSLGGSHISTDSQHTYYSSIFSNGKFHGTFTSPWYAADKPFAIKIGGWYGHNKDLEINIETKDGKIIKSPITGVNRIYYNTLYVSFSDTSKLIFRIKTKGNNNNSLSYLSFSEPYYQNKKEIFNNFLLKFLNIVLLIELILSIILFIIDKNRYIKYFIYFIGLSCYFIVDLTPIGIVPYTPRDNNSQRIFITNDGADYYEHLQSFFIDGYQPVATAGSIILENGKSVNVHGVGVAILQAPFFLLAKAISWLTDLNYGSGLNDIFQIFSAISSAFYFILGFYIIKIILTKYLQTNKVKFILSFLFFGTNLFFYATGTWGLNYSHIYSFCLLTVLVFLTINYYEKQGKELIIYSVLIGSIIGLNTCLRNHNCLFVIIFLLYDIKSFNDILIRLKKYFIYYIIAFIFTWIFFIPQMLSWHNLTGSLIINLYKEIGAVFNWGKPELLNLMFSVRKGLFIWTPFWIFAYLAPFIRTQLSFKWRFCLAIYLPLKLYMCASWYFWWYGGGFGQREYVDIIILAAIGLAIFIDFFSELDKNENNFFKRKQTYYICILIIFVIINIIYTKSIMQGFIPFDGAQTIHIINAFSNILTIY
jgi:hypothetical protein